MATQTAPDMNETIAPQRTSPVELAPSQTAQEESSWPRIIGLAGLSLAVLGAVVVLFNDFYGPRIVGKSFGIASFVLGMLFMLYHAIRDGNQEVRRAYGSLLGMGLIGVAGVISIVNRELFPTYGAASLLGSLCFLLAFARHEEDSFWRQLIVGGLMALGTVLALLGIGGGMFVPDFLTGSGLIMGFLGLAFLCGVLAQFDDSSPNRYLLAWAMTILGIVAVLYVLVRSNTGGDRPYLVPTGLLLSTLGILYGLTGVSVLSEAKIVVMTRRELASYFYSPVAYLVMLSFAIALGINYFFWLLPLSEGDTRREPIVQSLFFNFFGILTVLVVVPAITMRLFSEEKRTGTYEVLMCAPVSETAVVVSKFLASFVFYMLLWLPMGLYLIGLRMEGGKPFDYRPLLSFYLALAASGAAFVSMGLFFSSITKNQIIAFVMTFVGMLVLVIFSIMGSADSIRANLGPILANVMKHIGFISLWQESLSGKLPVRDLVLHGSLSVFWLFLTVRVLEARKWG